MSYSQIDLKYNFFTYHMARSYMFPEFDQLTVPRNHNNVYTKTSNIQPDLTDKSGVFYHNSKAILIISNLLKDLKSRSQYHSKFEKRKDL